MWATDAGEDFPCTDTGPHDALIGIHAHDGDWRLAGLVALAAEQDRPPLITADTYHAGSLPPRGGFLEVDPPGVPCDRSARRDRSAKRGSRTKAQAPSSAIAPAAGT